MCVVLWCPVVGRGVGTRRRGTVAAGRGEIRLEEQVFTFHLLQNVSAVNTEMHSDKPTDEFRMLWNMMTSLIVTLKKLDLNDKRNYYVIVSMSDYNLTHWYKAFYFL
ncbi:hypothetical protein J6590_100168 [Homalodisca vitripennis]|nr:hypothetical protein J6590_100168 [Homalodisca vitripennis]